MAGKAFNSSIRRWLFVLIPAVILLLDFLVFPVILENRRTQKDANIVDLLVHQPQLLGTFKSHSVYVSLDDIRDLRYLNYLKQNGNALVISVFVDDDGSASGGALQRAVTSKLQSVSPADYRKFVDTMRQDRTFAPGVAVPFVLDIPTDKYHAFPIDQLLILGFESGHIEDEEIKKGMLEVLNLAERQNVSNLVLPCLGSNWESKDSASFDRVFFNAFFDNLPASKNPQAIYLSLYSQWPSFELEEATASLNGAWSGTFQKVDKFPALYRRDFRLILLFLVLCLLVCSFFVTLTVRNFLIVSLSFAGAALGSNQLIDFFAQGYPTTVRFVLEIIVLMALAMGFPFIINWNPQEIFKRKEN